MVSVFLATVRLRSNRYREHGVAAGAIGVVVEDWGNDSYEVEFSNTETGETIALLTLPASEVDVIELAETSPHTYAND